MIKRLRHTRYRIPFLSMGFLLPLLLHGISFGFTCEGRIVSPGNTKAEVILKCGYPDWQEEYDETLITSVDKHTKQRITTTISEWTYNLGSNQFIRFLTFRNNRLVDITTGDYGYSKKEHSRAPCKDRVIAVGSTKAEVVLKCGNPITIERRTNALKENVDETTERITVMSIEEWTYNFGPGRFMRIFIFKNNRLVEIRTGEYGY